ncbi:TPA: glycosyltransferase [Kluyvera georgiana]
MDRVAIVISTFNSGCYLKETIDSCKRQSYKNLEIIIIDDHSSDGTVDYLRTVDGVKVFFNEKNNGISKNLNFAVNQTDANYIIFLGHDDVLPSTHVEVMLKEIKQDPEIAFVHCNAIKIDSDGNILGFARNSGQQIERSKKPLYYLAIDNFIQSCGLLFDREKFVAMGGWDEKYKLYGEWLSYVKFSSKWKIKFCCKTHGYYRVHANSTMKKINDEQKKQIRKYKRFCRDLSYSYLNKCDKDLYLFFKRGMLIAKENINYQ